MEHGIKLEDVVDDLREKLAGMAERARTGEHAVLFDVEGVEIELKVAVEKAGKVGGKASFKFWVIDAELGAEGTLSKSQTQTIKLKLKPRPRDTPPAAGTTMAISANDRLPDG